MPNGDTQITGDSCGVAHSCSYKFTFTYPDAMEVGETYDLVLSCRVVGSTVTKNPYKVTATISGSGFIVSKSIVNLLNTKTVQITPTMENPSISVETKLVLDGDVRQHTGFEAIYRDVFKLTGFNVITPVVEPPVIFDNSTNVDPVEGVNDTIGEPPVVEDPIGSEPDPPVHTDTPPDEVDTVVDQVNGTDVSGYQKDQVTMISVHINDKIVTTFTVAIADISVIPWYIVRSTGFISFYLLSASIFIAILKKIDPRSFASLTKFHHEVSWMSVILSLLHGVNNLIDGSIWNLSLRDVFWFDFTSTNAVYISLGVAGLYFIALVSVTSFKPMIKFLRYKKWYIIHGLSYIAYGIVILHSVMLGTDMSWLSPANNYSIFANFLFWLTTGANITGMLFYMYMRYSK